MLVAHDSSIMLARLQLIIFSYSTLLTSAAEVAHRTGVLGMSTALLSLSSSTCPTFLNQARRRCALSSISSMSSALYMRRPRLLRRNAPSIAEEIGCSPALNYELFDPLNLASDDTFPRYREMELKHGRVAMLATVGMGVPDLFPSIVPRELMLSRLYNMQFGDIPCGLKALSVLPWEGWLQIVAAIGVIELFVLRQRDSRDMPGDYGLGYFGLRDKGRHERSLLAELENGRLAMVAFVVQVVLELVTGKTIGNQWRDAFQL